MEHTPMTGIVYDSGYIYCMKEMNTGRFKIGKTYRHPKVRLNELNGSGSSDKNLQFRFCILIKNYDSIEKDIHKHLENLDYRYVKNREFFTCTEKHIRWIFSQYSTTIEDNTNINNNTNNNTNTNTNINTNKNSNITNKNSNITNKNSNNK